MVWQLVAAVMNEAANVFIVAEPYLKDMRMPLSLHVLRMLWKNLIIFGHNALIIVAVLIFLGPGWTWTLLLAPVGLGLLMLNGVWIGLLVGLVCARYRDMAQIVASVVQLAFFLTPIVWKPESLGRHRWAADINPLTHFIELVRAPLLGQVPSALSWAVTLGVLLAGFAIALPFFARFRSRVAYWV